MTAPVELKVGDRVRMMERMVGDPTNGTYGVIVETDGPTLLKASWEGWTKGHPGYRSEWWVVREQVRKLPDKRGGDMMDEYCRGCRFLVLDGAVCHCIKGWPERPCDQKEKGRPTRGEIAQAIDEGLIPMEPDRGARA